jgi:hypothetical protein
MPNPNPKTENLKSWKPGESGNPKGAIKGRPTLKTIIKNMLEDEDIDWKKTSLNDTAKLENKYGKNGWKALVYVAFSKGMSGDMRAMDWLRRAQYGDKINLIDEEGNTAPIFVYDLSRPKPKTKSKSRKKSDATRGQKGGSKPQTTRTNKSSKKPKI